MKKVILSAVLFFTLAIAYSQQEQTASDRQLRHEQRADSAIASKGVKQIKQFLTITPEQETALFQAGKTANQAKRGVFKSYWKTGAFEKEMAKAERLQDSLYMSVLGETQYYEYRTKLSADRLRRLEELRLRAQRNDSTTTKPDQQ